MPPLATMPSKLAMVERLQPAANHLNIPQRLPAKLDLGFEAADILQC
jgi:hypothetical protein